MISHSVAWESQEFSHGRKVASDGYGRGTRSSELIVPRRELGKGLGRVSRKPRGTDIIALG